MGIILCIETSTTNCSVAVSENERLISLIERDAKNYSHAEQLHLFIEKALAEANVDKTQLDAVAISKGPGSYTGLRIGVSSAKGLCYALDIPLIGISTLKTLAAQVKLSGESGLIIPMIDARRMEVYTQIFSLSLKELTEIEAKVLGKESYREYFETSNGIHVIGNGAKKFEDILEIQENIQFSYTNPSAREMVELASKKNKQHQFEDVAYFEPFYLKDFVAGK